MACVLGSDNYYEVYPMDENCLTTFSLESESGLYM